MSKEAFADNILYGGDGFDFRELDDALFAYWKRGMKSRLEGFHSYDDVWGDKIYNVFFPRKATGLDFLFRLDDPKTRLFTLWDASDKHDVGDTLQFATIEGFVIIYRDRVVGAGMVNDNSIVRDLGFVFGPKDQIEKWRGLLKDFVASSKTWSK
jgi:hypothetical protein